MSQANTSSSVVPNWVDSSLLQGMLRGIERESLRLQKNGFLSQGPHPQALGSALTHPHITTDYSEALLELITPPKASIDEVLDCLKDLHKVVYDSLENEEKIWPMSMPCMLDENEDSIRLADYGSSNIGRFKTLYRRGLGVRYGRRMQTIAGVHYNLSFPDTLFEALQQHEQDEELKKLSLQDYRSHRYFGLIRNFIRLTPMVMYLLGASPSVCQCFLSGKEHQLLPLVRGTLFSPYATALRMGRFGYQNSAQKQLGIHYNSLQGYLEGLQRAVKTTYKPFSRLGLNDAQGEPIQINDHVLQIENEYYSFVRPKQIPQAGETPSQALANRGVAYVELRAVDVNPYSAIGIDSNAAAFLEVLALYCLLQDSPEIAAQEQDLIERNQAEVVNRGRALNVKILETTASYDLEDWLMQHLTAMTDVSCLLDQAYGSNSYSEGLEEMIERAQDVEQTLSSHILADIVQAGGTWVFASHLIHEHEDEYAMHELSADQQAAFQHMAQDSIQQQQALEDDSSQSFEHYLAAYR